MLKRLLFLIFVMVMGVVHADAAEKDFSQCFPVSMHGQVVEDHAGNWGRWVLVEGQSENYQVRIHWGMRENPIAQGVLRYSNGYEVSFGSRPVRPQPPRSCRVGVPCH